MKSLKRMRAYTYDPQNKNSTAMQRSIESRRNLRHWHIGARDLRVCMRLHGHQSPWKCTWTDSQWDGRWHLASGIKEDVALFRREHVDVPDCYNADVLLWLQWGWVVGENEFIMANCHKLYTTVLMRHWCPYGHWSKLMDCMRFTYSCFEKPPAYL